jgi:hypothetical protein
MFKLKYILIFLNDSYGSHRISGYRPVWISFEKKNTLLGGICLLAKKKIRLAYMYVELSTWHMSVGNVWAGRGIWHLAYGNTWFTCMSRALTMAFGKYPSCQKKILTELMGLPRACPLATASKRASNKCHVGLLATPRGDRSCTVCIMRCR